jgi:hypothetical protein
MNVIKTPTNAISTRIIRLIRAEIDFNMHECEVDSMSVIQLRMSAISTRKVRFLH